MLKPNALRAHLTAAVPEFKRTPSALTLFVSGGNVAARMGANLGYEYSYTLNLTVLDYAEHPDTIFFPLMHWLRHHQPDLLENHQKANEAVRFEVDIIDAKTVDISIEIQLTESVDVALQPDGKYHMTYRAEPDLVGQEPLSDMGTLPDNAVFLMTPYGEYLLSSEGQVLIQNAG